MHVANGTTARFARMAAESNAAQEGEADSHDCVVFGELEEAVMRAYRRCCGKAGEGV